MLWVGQFVGQVLSFHLWLQGWRGRRSGVLRVCSKRREGSDAGDCACDRASAKRARSYMEALTGPGRVRVKSARVVYDATTSTFDRGP